MFDNRVISHSSQGGHVQHITYLFSASPYPGPACEAAGTKIIGSDAYKGGDLLSVEQAQFGQLRQKDGAGLWSYTWGASEDFVFAAEFVIGLDMFDDEFIEVCDLVIECFYYFSYTFLNLPETCGLLSVQLLCSQVGKLMSPSYQVGQFIGFTAELRPWPGFYYLCEASQDVCIDGVCLGQFADAFCEVTYLPGRSDYDVEFGFEQCGSDGTFIAAGRFEDNQADIVGPESLEQLFDTAGGIGQGQIDRGRRRADAEGIFCYVYAYENLFVHGTLPILQMRARRTCGPLTALSAVRAGPTVAARIMLCDDLLGLGTLDLSSPAARSSSRYARLTASCFNYGTFNHD